MGQRLLLILLVLYPSLSQLVSAEPDCRNGYFESNPGYKLQGHVIKRISTESIWSCVLECRRIFMCFSLNVHKDKDSRIQCELNKSTKQANPTDYVRVPSSGQEYLNLILDRKDQWMSRSLDCFADREVLPNDWYRYHSSAYKYFNEKLTNQLARQRCLNLHTGVDLVSLENEMEKEFVKSLAYVKSTANDTTPTNDIIYWIGLNDKTTEGTFVWYDGRPFNYTNWAAPEPNDHESKEDCVISFADGSWNDVPCDHNYDFVCKVLDFRQL